MGRRSRDKSMRVRLEFLVNSKGYFGLKNFSFIVLGALEVFDLGLV